MTTWQTLEWDDIGYLADRAFRWNIGDGATWVEWMWQYLSQENLTRYRTELERCRVKVQLLALADLYNEFCWMAYQEPQDEEYCDWAKALELSSFRVGQLMGDDADFGDEETHELTLTQAALIELMQDARSRILPCLAKRGGGTMGLLKGLYGCSQYRCKDATAIAAVNVELSFENMAIYSWLEGEIATAEAAVRSSPPAVQPPTSPVSDSVQLSLSM